MEARSAAAVRWRVVAAVFQEWAGLDESVADRVGADFKQFAEDLPCADFPLVEDGSEDPLGIGDLLSEGAASGFGESFTAASLIAEAFEAGGLERGESLDHLAEFFAAHRGQSRVRKRFGDWGRWAGTSSLSRKLRGCAAVVNRDGGKPDGGGGDRDLVVGEQLAGLGDPIAVGPLWA